MFKGVALGFLFLGAGKVVEKGFRAFRAMRAGDEMVELADKVIDVADNLPILKFSRKKMPNIADNIDEAIETGQPKVLARETDKSAISANRRNALKGVDDAIDGNSLDEYPFASSKEGGVGANVKSVPVKEQNIQGGTMSSFYKKMV